MTNSLNKTGNQENDDSLPGFHPFSLKALGALFSTWQQPLKLIATACLVWLLLAKVKWDVLAEAFAKADLRWIPLVLVFSGIMIFLRVYKWYGLLHYGVGAVPFRDAWFSLIGGASLAIITPARLGEIGRVIFLPTSDKLRAGKLVVLDRLVDLSTVFLFGSLGAAVIGQRAWALLSGVATLMIFYIILRPYGFHRLLDWLKDFPWSNKLVSALRVSERGAPLPLFLGQLGIAGCRYLFDLLSFYLLLSAFEPVRLAPICFAFPLILLSNILPFTVAGLGVREGTSMLLLSGFGISPAAAINASFLLFVLNTLLPGLVGALLFLRPVPHPHA